MRVWMLGSKDLEQRKNMGFSVLRHHDADMGSGERGEHRVTAVDEVGNRCRRIRPPRSQTRTGQYIVGGPVRSGDLRRNGRHGFALPAELGEGSRHRCQETVDRQRSTADNEDPVIRILVEPQMILDRREHASSLSPLTRRRHSHMTDQSGSHSFVAHPSRRVAS